MKNIIKHSKFVNRFIHETGLSIPDVTRLFELEKKLTEYNERECSEELTDQMIRVMENNRMNAIAEVHRLLGNSVVTVGINTDPRGPAIRMKMASDWYNCPDQTLALDME